MEALQAGLRASQPAAPEPVQVQVLVDHTTQQVEHGQHPPPQTFRQQENVAPPADLGPVRRFVPPAEVPTERHLSTKERVLKAKADRVAKEQADRMRELANADYDIAKTRYEGMRRAKGEFKPTVALVDEGEVGPCAPLGESSLTNVIRAPGR